MKTLETVLYKIRKKFQTNYHWSMQEFQLRGASRRRERQRNKSFGASISLPDPDVLKSFKANRNWNDNKS